MVIKRGKSYYLNLDKKIKDYKTFITKLALDPNLIFCFDYESREFYTSVNNFKYGIKIIDREVFYFTEKRNYWKETKLGYIEGQNVIKSLYLRDYKMGGYVGIFKVDLTLETLVEFYREIDIYNDLFPNKYIGKARIDIKKKSKQSLLTINHCIMQL